MAKHVTLNPDCLKEIRTVDEKLMSYNVEMTEVTGGTFWKAYTPGQIEGTEEFKLTANGLSDFTAMADLMQYYPPINLYDEKLRKLAKDLGPAWIRVSGSWATKTYYDFEGTTGGKAPEGYASVLTKEQWIGVLEFVKAVGGKDGVEIFVDCSMDTGADAYKALALGAKAVAVGRAIMQPLLKGGAEGVIDYVGRMNNELRMIMGFTGCPTTSDLRPDVLWHEGKRMAP